MAAPTAKRTTQQSLRPTACEAMKPFDTPADQEDLLDLMASLLAINRAIDLLAKALPIEQRLDVMSQSSIVTERLGKMIKRMEG